MKTLSHCILLACAGFLTGPLITVAQQEFVGRPSNTSARLLAKPMPGQIVISQEHPQWLRRHGGGYVYICGPGDPEDFLYRGQRRADGTRDGDQVALIEKLIQHGGNCIYMQVARTHGGDAKSDRTHNPFVDSDPRKGLDEDILNQWEEWFALMDRHEILIYLFFYDDGTRIWNTGDEAGPEEKAFFTAIVNRFKHHKNLIWVVVEESEERYSPARVQALARVIRDADEHGHLIGNHHHSGTTFKAWQSDGALNHYSMQLSSTDDAAHTGAIEALNKAAGRYQVIYSESTAMRKDNDGMRTHAWAVAMGGLMPMLLGMDIDAPVETFRQCRYLQQFFEATDFYTMSPHDELKSGETKYVLADARRSYIAYGDRVTAGLGLSGLPAGRCEIAWLDCRTGSTLNEVQVLARAGDCVFEKPPGIGEECAAWIRFPDLSAAGSNTARAAENLKRASIAENRSPVSDDQRITAKPGEKVYVQLRFTDEDGPGPYSYTIVRRPEHGVLSGDDNDRWYTPNASFIGTDSFTWRVHDGKAESNIRTITIVVTGQRGTETK